MRFLRDHGDRQTGTIMSVRVQRGRRNSVVGEGTMRIGCRSRLVIEIGRIGLGIAPERGDTALDSLISRANTCPARCAENVRDERPQACARANRIVGSKQSGVGVAASASSSVNAWTTWRTSERFRKTYTIEDRANKSTLAGGRAKNAFYQFRDFGRFARSGSIRFGWCSDRTAFLKTTEKMKEV